MFEEKQLKDLGFSIEYTFVPWSKSRSFKESKYVVDYNLNFKVTLLYKDRPIISDMDYSMGQEHCPAYKNPPMGTTFHSGNRNINAFNAAIRHECETGYRVRSVSSALTCFCSKNLPIKPELALIVYCIFLDSDVLYYTFEDWCANLGYSDDSIKAKAIYDDCIKQSVQWNAAVPENIKEKVRVIFENY